MAFKFVLALALISAASATLLDKYCDWKQIDGGLSGMPCIIKGMCEAQDDEAGRLKAFYACYDDIPTREFFFECMKTWFGGQLNNSAVVKESCLTKNLWKAAPYGACLTMKFKSPKNMNEAVDKINKCQAKALGYNAAE